MDKISKKDKTKKQSAGIILFNIDDNLNITYLLVHPGGPFWKNRTTGSWSIPKGEIEENDDILKTAIREFEEETGIKAEEPFIDLGSIKQKAGKVVYAWACKGDKVTKINCTSMVNLEYPSNSGKILTFPEVDDCKMYTKEECKVYINSAQYELIEKLEKYIKTEYFK